MKLRMGCVLVGFLLFVLSIAANCKLWQAQTPSATVPSLVNLPERHPKCPQRQAAHWHGWRHLFLYQDQQGGAPLWLETRNVQAGKKTGHYSVALGSATSQGVPASVFASPAKPHGWACRFRDRRSSRASC